MIRSIVISTFLILLTWTQVYAQTASEVIATDTRSDATTPATYNNRFKVQFKASGSIGVPSSSGSNYHTVLGFRGWGDNSGGKAHEMSFGDDGQIYIRSGFDPSWEGWRRFLVENSSGNVGIGTISPEWKLDVHGAVRLRGSLYVGDMVDDGVSSHILGPGRWGPDNQVTIASGPGSYYAKLQFKTGASGLQGSILAYQGLWMDADRHVYRNLNGSAFLVEFNNSGTNLNKLDAATMPATKFLVAEGGSNLLKYRTKEELVADLGITGGSGNSSWTLGGNSGTSPTTHFIGTNDNQGFALRTNNQERLRIDATGKVGIGTIVMNDNDYKLFVETGIRTRKVKVDINSWADYVFEPSYQLPSLREVENHIRRYRHLPELPSASEVAKNGVDLGENQVALLKKIEELTLYLINQNKEQESQADALKELNAKVAHQVKVIAAQAKLLAELQHSLLQLQKGSK